MNRYYHNKPYVMDNVEFVTLCKLLPNDLVGQKVYLRNTDFYAYISKVDGKNCGCLWLILDRSLSNYYERPDGVGNIVDLVHCGEKQSTSHDVPPETYIIMHRIEFMDE